MTDLPTLKVGCGENIGAGYCASVKPEYVVHYCGRTCSCKDIFYCETCKIIRDKVLPVLKAHAAAYLKDVVIWSNEAVTEATSLRNVYYNLGRAEGARDAVLALTDEISMKDLEGGGE